MKNKPRSQPPQAVEDCHQCLCWLIPQLDRFPRNRRFTLGEKIETRLLSVLENLVDAAYIRATDRRQILRRANNQLAVARHLWRLSYELKLCPMKQYQHGARLMVNIGRQVGGWMKQAQ